MADDHNYEGHSLDNWFSFTAFTSNTSEDWNAVKLMHSLTYKGSFWSSWIADLRDLWSNSCNWSDFMICNSQYNILYFVTLLNLMIFHIRYICDIFYIFSTINVAIFVTIFSYFITNIDFYFIKKNNNNKSSVPQDKQEHFSWDNNILQWLLPWTCLITIDSTQKIF